MLLKLFSLAAAVLLALSATVPNIDSVYKQLQARAGAEDSIIEPLLNSLSTDETDYIEYNLRHLLKNNDTKCEQCHYKIKYAQELIEEDPEKQHLISLMLYRWCLAKNKNKDTKCEFIDFFLTTNGGNNADAQNNSTGIGGAFEGASSLNFFDNDFTEMIKHFNVSSNLSLNYYCYFKGGYCDLPETPDLKGIIDLESLWPEKQDEYKNEPFANVTKERFNVLHLSDLHDELRYQVGSEANCSQGLCCLPESYNEDLTDGSYNFTEVYKKAGATGAIDLSFYPGAHYQSNDSYVPGPYYDLPLYRGWNWANTPSTTFGHYACDPPEVLLNNSLGNVAGTMAQNKYEFSLFTGDIVDHDVIHCDANVTKFAEIRSYGIMKHYLKNISVFPTLGNHDTFPYGQLAPERLQNQTLNLSIYHWNDELMANLWIGNGWLNESARDIVSKHYSAYSTVTARGLKVISLNSNCYYQKNLYAYINMESEPDLFGQWDFLINELVESEKSGQRVWILAHIPTGSDDCLPIQSAIFKKIIERFSPYTIANVFFGHTHRDQFKVLYSDDNEPLNMAWISQSITPLNGNPSWRYYEVEDKTFNIMNVHNYYTPLNETWVHGAQEPEWIYEYNPRDQYDSEKLWPSDAPLNATFWDKYVVQNLKNSTDTEFNQLYTNYLWRFSPYTPNCSHKGNVSSGCYTDNYCDVIGFDVDTTLKCAGNV